MTESTPDQSLENSKPKFFKPNQCFSLIHEEDRSNENKFSETVLIFFFEPIVKYVDFQLWLIAELDLEFVPKRLSLSQID